MQAVHKWKEEQKIALSRKATCTLILLLEFLE